MSDLLIADHKLPHPDHDSIGASTSRGVESGQHRWPTELFGAQQPKANNIPGLEQQSPAHFRLDTTREIYVQAARPAQSVITLPPPNSLSTMSPVQHPMGTLAPASSSSPIPGQDGEEFMWIVSGVGFGR